MIIMLYNHKLKIITFSFALTDDLVIGLGRFRELKLRELSLLFFLLLLLFLSIDKKIIMVYFSRICENM